VGAFSWIGCDDELCRLAGGLLLEDCAPAGGALEAVRTKMATGRTIAILVNGLYGIKWTLPEVYGISTASRPQPISPIATIFAGKILVAQTRFRDMPVRRRESPKRKTFAPSMRKGPSHLA
jgi:hypothetical protein